MVENVWNKTLFKNDLALFLKLLIICKLKESYNVVSQRNIKATQDYVIYYMYLHTSTIQNYRGCEMDYSLKV